MNDWDPTTICSALAGIDMWHTTYEHVMESAVAMVSWMKGTGLRQFPDALSLDLQPRFLSEYEVEVDRAYPSAIDGKKLMHFPRIFVCARRAL